MSKMLLEDTPAKREWLFYDEMTDESQFVTEWKDVGDVIERNKAIQGKDAGKSKSGDLHYVGSIPLALVEKWKTEEGIDAFNPDHWQAVARKLDSNEFSGLRVNMGRLGVRKKMY